MAILRNPRHEQLPELVASAGPLIDHHGKNANLKPLVAATRQGASSWPSLQLLKQRKPFLREPRVLLASWFQGNACRRSFRRSFHPSLLACGSIPKLRVEASLSP